MTGVTPNIGAAEGATAVRVAGTNFVPSPRLVFGELRVDYRRTTSVTYRPTTISSLRCRFGNESVPAVFHSATSLHCMAPLASAAASNVGVTIVPIAITTNGVDYGATTVQFTFVASPIVEAISPRAGSVEGGSVVTVTGANFVDTEALACVINGQPLPSRQVRWISSTAVTCTMPDVSSLRGDHTNGSKSLTNTVSLAVSNAGGEHPSAPVADYQYLRAITLDSVWPTAVPALTQATTITVSVGEGHDYGSKEVQSQGQAVPEAAAVGGLRCVVMDSAEGIVAAAVATKLNDTTMKCTLPALTPGRNQNRRLRAVFILRVNRFWPPLYHRHHLKNWIPSCCTYPSPRARPRQHHTNQTY